MDQHENSFVSQLRQPSRIPSPPRLVELSSSDNNARSSTLMPPPPGNLKRKTLVERAGEPPRPAPAPPSSRLVNAGIKATSIAGASRHTAVPSSVSTRPPSSSLVRHASNSSLSSSMGLGSRPPSTQSFRPQSAMARSTQKLLPNNSRPASSFDTHSKTNGAMQTFGDSKSINPFSSTQKRYPAHLSQPKMPRGSYDNQMNYVSDWSSSVNDVVSQRTIPRSLRDVSLSTALSGLTLEPSESRNVSLEEMEPQCSPSQIPIRTPTVSLAPRTPSPSKSRRKTQQFLPFLTRDSNTKAIAWDPQSRLEIVEDLYHELKESMHSTSLESNGLKETISIYKPRVNDLETMRVQLSNNNTALQRDLDSTRVELASSSLALQEAKRHHSNDADDLKRQQRRDLDEAYRDADEKIHRLVRQHQDEISDLKRRHENLIEDEKSRRRKEIQTLSVEGTIAQQKVEGELNMKERALHAMQEELDQAKADLLRERERNHDLQSKLSEARNHSLSLESSMRSLRARIDFLESDCKSQSQAFADLEQRTQDAIKQAAEANDKLRIEESLRRKLHNQVQELKGNIRVFCRVRPSLETDQINETARISFPDNQGDSKELEVLGPEEKSSLGTITKKKNSFTFDRVFNSASQNADVFGEISQLIQSALDGYNVCIFCYGQTGAGKTYTMSSEDGMIPRAVRQIYDTAQALEEKGWRYSMEGSFIEVYNENINDLLGKADDLDKKKHEIRHDMQKCKTTITDITTVQLDSPTRVESILRQATANRSVAATKANERSSRSHSVFILKLTGENHITGERSEGTLNLVDLAGSERLSHSCSTGERLKETQNINKSLSCLGDVIGALGQGKEGGHVPYRNSKLTYLLQFSLGGNSKTLMFVMISPLQAHLSETLTSLKFATKVHNTHIGTARRQNKIRET